MVCVGGWEGVKEREGGLIFPLGSFWSYSLVPSWSCNYHHQVTLTGHPGERLSAGRFLLATRLKHPSRCAVEASYTNTQWAVSPDEEF